LRLAILAVVGIVTASVGLYLESLFLAVRSRAPASDAEVEGPDQDTPADPQPPISDALGPPQAVLPLAGVSWLQPPNRDGEPDNVSQDVPYWIQALALEVALGAVFLLLGLKYHNATHLVLACVYSALLFEMAVIDFHYRLVLDILSFPSAAVAIAGSTLWSGIGIGRSLLGGVLALVLFFIIELVGRGAMGRGDTKLAGVIGFMRGFPAVIGALVAGILIGGLMALGLLIAGRGRRSTFAYGPALAIGVVVSLLLGHS
jgi:leader peptidase (prepilin peptidase)/N-methyltransferase